MKAFVLSFVLGLVVACPGFAQTDQILLANLQDTWAGQWETPPASEYQSAKLLFQLILESPLSDQLMLQAERLSMELTEADSRGLMIMKEKTGSQRGRGWYAFRQADYQPVILQIPHARADLRTGEIGIQWMSSLPFQVLAVNTVHRRSGEDEDAADMSRQDRSYFMALAEAAAAVYAHPGIRQLHGFSSDNRTTAAGRLAEVIVSSGSRQPTPPALAVASCLSAMSLQTRIYGIDVNELGGTINPLSRFYINRSVPGYLHVEVVRSVRERFMNDLSFSVEAGACLLGASRR